MYEWDETKRLETLRQRGIDFADMERFEWQGAVILQDTRRDYGETRFRAFGQIDDRLYAVVYTMRVKVMRIISLRKANAREQRLWTKN